MYSLLRGALEDQFGWIKWVITSPRAGRFNFGLFSRIFIVQNFWRSSVSDETILALLGMTPYTCFILFQGSDSSVVMMVNIIRL